MAEIDVEIQNLYVAYFGRPADPGGLAFWTDRLEENPAIYGDIARAFASSNEYLSHYSHMDTRAVVMELYDNLFSRPGDEGGVAFWVKALDSGAMTFDDMVLKMIDGAQGNDAVAYGAKVVVATIFTESVDTPQEIAAYSGALANEIAVSYIGGVNDVATATTAMLPENIDATLARMVVGTAALVEAELVGVAEPLPA